MLDIGRISNMLNYNIRNTTEQLSPEEQQQIIDDLFPKNKEYIESVGTYLADNFRKIDGFDYRWSSLITSKPLLFEDIDYVRIRDFVKTEITKEEIEAYKNGQLRELYGTFENLLICNLPYYNRIISFCTMVFLHYVRITNNGVDSTVTDDLSKLPYFIEMTPTQIWCCACCGPASTKWELEYAWKTNRKTPIKIVSDNLIKDNFRYLYKNNVFARFVEYCALRVGTNGFMQTLITDKTPNNKLAQVCSKFTKTSTAIDESQLQTLGNYILESKHIDELLYNSLDKCLNQIYKGHKDQYSIFIYANEFLVCTKNFKLKFKKRLNRLTNEIDITKEYISNAYMCLISEANMVETIKDQINWTRSNLDISFDYDKNILKSILKRMLNEDYKNIKCLKRQLDSTTYSEITFKKCWNNFKAIEVCYSNDMLVYEYPVVTYGINNMVDYIIDKGYYIFGTIHDVDVLFIKDITINTLVNHYSNYCIPVLQHMSDVIQLHVKSKNEIIDVVCDNKEPRINNDVIRYTTSYAHNKLTSKEIMNQLRNINESKINKQIQNHKQNKSTNIWKVHE